MSLSALSFTRKRKKYSKAIRSAQRFFRGSVCAVCDKPVLGSFGAELARNARDALAEDMGAKDQTGHLIPPDKECKARVIVREEAVLCGAPWFSAVMRQ